LHDDLQENAQAVVDSVVASVEKDASGYGPREFAFTCTLFSNNTAISAFAFGPVRFEPRLDWLKRRSGEGDIPAINERRIRRVWNGEKLAKRKTSLGSLREKDILDAVGKAPYVCSVSTSGFAREAGIEKALTAARLALTAIALLWQTPSKVLEGLNLSYDRAVRLQKSLIFTPGKITHSGSRLSHMPHGPYLKGGEWDMKDAVIQSSSWQL
jgi:hypothetical protein